MIGDILSWLGIGGSLTFIVGLAASFGLLSTFLPGIVVNALSVFAETVLRIATWLADKFFRGVETICGDWRAVFTLIVCMVVSGWVGDKYDPWRNLMDKPKPQMSSPQPKSQPKQTSRTTTRRTAPPSDPITDAFDYVRNSLSRF